MAGIFEFRTSQGLQERMMALRFKGHRRNASWLGWIKDRESKNTCRLWRSCWHRSSPASSRWCLHCRKNTIGHVSWSHCPRYNEMKVKIWCIGMSKNLAVTKETSHSTTRLKAGKKKLAGRVNSCLNIALGRPIEITWPWMAWRLTTINTYFFAL